MEGKNQNRRITARNIIAGGATIVPPTNLETMGILVMGSVINNTPHAIAFRVRYDLSMESLPAQADGLKHPA
jgi:hypothetical protein